MNLGPQFKATDASLQGSRGADPGSVWLQCVPGTTAARGTQWGCWEVRQGPQESFDTDCVSHSSLGPAPGTPPVGAPHGGTRQPPAPESPSQPPATGAVGEAASSKLHRVRPPRVRVGDGVPTPSPPTAPARGAGKGGCLWAPYSARPVQSTQLKRAWPGYIPLFSGHGWHPPETGGVSLGRVTEERAEVCPEGPAVRGSAGRRALSEAWAVLRGPLMGECVPLIRKVWGAGPVG